MVIDSIDALAEKYNICSKLLSTISATSWRATIQRPFVLESSNTDLDYLGDGVVMLRTEFNRRRIRELACASEDAIQQPKYIFTLDKGRIQTFGYQRLLNRDTRQRGSPYPTSTIVSPAASRTSMPP